MKPPQMATAAFQDFLTAPLQARLARHLTTSPQDRVVELFRSAARDVPAYREFLTSQGIDSADVKTYADFQTLSLTTKQNYMLAYPLPALTRDGRLAECEMVAVSSGSTGRPLFWPRSSMHELDIATRFEHVFHGSFHADPRPTKPLKLHASLPVRCESRSIVVPPQTETRLVSNAGNKTPAGGNDFGPLDDFSHSVPPIYKEPLIPGPVLVLCR